MMAKIVWAEAFVPRKESSDTYSMMILLPPSFARILYSSPQYTRDMVALSSP